MRRPRPNDKVWNHERRRALTGYFFETFVHFLLRGAEHGVSRTFKRKDMIHWALGSLIEVKAVDNGHIPTLFVDQFERHMQSVPFPLDHVLYAICCYKVKRKQDGVSVSELAECTPTVRSLERFLTSHLTHVFLVHHKVLQLHLKSGNTALRRGREVISLSRSALLELAQDPARLRHLKIEVVHRHKKLNFRRMKFRFRLTLLVPASLTDRVLDMMAEKPKPRRVQRTA